MFYLKSMTEIFCIRKLKISLVTLKLLLPPGHEKGSSKFLYTYVNGQLKIRLRYGILVITLTF